MILRNAHCFEQTSVRFLSFSNVNRVFKIINNYEKIKGVRIKYF